MVPEYSDAKRNLLEKYLRGELGARRSTPPIPRRNSDRAIPLSYAQEQVWLHAQLVPEVPLYNEPVTIHYSGELDVAALERSFNEILRRHEAWRTRFMIVDGRPVQEVIPSLSVSLPLIDLRTLARPEREAAALNIATADARNSIDMGQVPLFRVKLIQLEDQEFRLYLVLSHIIFDGVAIYRVLLPELSTLYKACAAGQPSPLPELTLQYPDYASWQRQGVAEHTFAKDIEFWRKRLSGPLPETYLPADRPHRSAQSFRGSMYPFKLSRRITEELRSFSRTEGVSLFHVLLAGFAALLYRYSGEETIPIGSVTAGRNRPETEPLLGYFLNTVVLPANLAGDPSFREMVNRARNLTIDVMEHDSLPFEHLVRELRINRDPSRNPLFQALFSLEPPLPEIDPAWRLTQMDVDTGASKYDLSLELDERSEEVLARFHYSTDLFDTSTIVRMVAHWQNFLAGAVANPNHRISELTLLTADEEHQLAEWNMTDVDLPQSQLLHKYFEDQVERTPAARAVTFEDRHLTYAELNAKADQVAYHLKNLGVGPEVAVALYFDRSIEMLVAIIGVLKAGGACLPLDPSHPADRVAFMLAETEAPVVLTLSRLQAQVPTNKPRIVCLDTYSDGSPDRVKSLPLQPASPDNTAYIIYTSGSTGQPKGVRVLHRGLVNSTQARTAFYPERLQSFLLLSAFTFDSSLAGIFWTLSVGGTLVLSPDPSQWELDSLSSLIEKHQVSHLLCVPSLYRTLIESSPVERLASLKVAIVAGESCPVALVNEHYSRLPHAALYNEYGPTEATVWCSVYRCEPQADAIRVPIGRPIANTQLYVVDSHQQRVPVGVPGELLVGGAGVAGGYWKRPDLTTGKFITNPFSPNRDTRLYKTGDLARFLPDGNIEYFGRLDHQVKLRGFRIELGEIEAALASHPAVQEAVVVAREDVPGEKRLVAYYTASDANGQASGVSELRSHLASKLPDYMVPVAFVRMERMPLTANGKLDRKALPVPERDGYTACGYEAPQGEIERRLAGIWEDVLRVERVGRQDNFFELGGHSLLAVMLIERMRQVGVRANVRTLFLTPTLAGLAAAADTGVNVQVPENRIPMACEVITPQMLPLVKLSQEEIDRIVNGVPGGARNVQDIYPLAPLQEGILFHYLLGGEGDPYLLGTLLSFDTRSRLDSYVEAMQKVIDRHDILRTAVMWEGLTQPVQVVQRKALLLVEEVKLYGAGDANRLLYAQFDPRLHRIDVRQAPLLRVYIAYDEQKDRWLMVELLHHLAGDHVTLEVMEEEVQAHLLNRAHALPVPQSFRNLVAQARLGGSQEEHQAYFRKLLEDVDEPTAPFGLLNVQGDGTEIEEAHTLLDSVLARRIRERARRLGVSAASVCHLAWAQVLARVSGRDDVVFGTVLFGRMQGGPGADRGMGLFINTLPVRIQIGEGGAEASVRQVHAQLADLLQHEHASLALAQRCSAVAAPAPLFSALLNYRHSGGAAWTRSPETARAWDGIEVIHRDERTSYPFTLSVDDLAEGFTLTAQTVASVGAKRVCEYMRTALEALVEALDKDPGRAVRTLDVLPLAERGQVLSTFNDTAAEYPKEKCVHELFEEQVEKHPENTALVFEDTSLTYAELNCRANQLAHYLRELGVRPDTCVGICVKRGFEMVVGLLAILKAGGAYVPLDPTYPAERLRYMLKDSAPAVLLTQGHLARQFTEISAILPVLPLDGGAPAWHDQPQTNIDRASIGLTPEHLAYVIYTSGSTGLPKGVAVGHRPLVNYLQWASDAYTPDNAVVASSLSFDATVTSLYVPLLRGGTTRLLLEHGEIDGLEHQVQQARTCGLVKITPVHLDVLGQRMLSERTKTAVSVFVIGGEPLSSSTVRLWRQIQPDVRLVNEYGPTEAVVGCVTYDIPGKADLSKSVPIGRPIANARVYILDGRGEPVPVGVGGELYIAGDGVARGYLNRPALTAERFLKDPFVEESGARMYRTGDMGRWMADGVIEYLGRNDDQVKIRGFRIELGEIEATLASHPAVREAVVVAREDVAGDKRLVAYYTASDAKRPATGARELRSHLSSKLPEYMVPAAYVRIAQMPLTVNGKLDRKALPTPEGNAYAVRGYEAPQSESESCLAEIWADILRVKRVGRYDNFFELGGHSLLAMQLTARIRHSFGLELPLRSVFEEPTIAGMAGELQKAKAQGLKARTPILQRRTSAMSGSSREALLAQLEKLSAEEAQSLLRHMIEKKHPV